MENKGNKNPQSNMSPSAQSNSNTTSSSVGSSSQSSASSASGSQSSKQSGQSSSSKSGIGDTVSKESLNNLTSKLQQFGSSTMEKVNGLSTTQKVVGGSLLALGAGWVAMNSMNKNKMGNIGSKIANAQDKLNKNLKKSGNR